METMKILTELKRKEWYQWGKEAYKSSMNMMRSNAKHPDYDTKEKREAMHDIYSDSHLLKDERKNALREKWGYSDEAIAEAMQLFKDGYNASRAWYKKADAKMQAVIDEYKAIWKEAEKVAKNTDVSDIKDGFPCGSAHLYLDNYPEGEELRKALGHFSTSVSDSSAYKYRLPIKMPSYGQCVAFDERICGKVREFLRSKAIFANIHSWID